jgi:hypothetical protein
VRSSPLRELTIAVWLCLCRPGARFSAGNRRRLGGVIGGELVVIAAASWPFWSLSLAPFLVTSRLVGARWAARRGLLCAHAGGGTGQNPWLERCAPCLVVSEATWRLSPPPAAPLFLADIRLLSCAWLVVCGGGSHVATYVRCSSGTRATGWIQSAGCLWWVKTVSPTCSAMSRTAVRLRSAATTAQGERSLQKRMGGCCVNKLCVHIGFFAMSLAPPRHQPPSQL